MIRFSLVFVSFCFLQTYSSAGQEQSVKFYGYVGHQVIFDTYRSLDTRDGQLYFYPLRENLDPNGLDINRKTKLSMVEVQSRIGARIRGPQLLGADVRAVLEADFYGTQQDYVRLMRLRQAHISMSWEQHELLMGNTFHPSFVLECFPNTVSFAAGVPFHPLNRSPQLRYIFKPSEKLNLSLSFLTHGYHKSAGPAQAQRNSGLPDTQFRLQYADGHLQSVGFVAGYKFLTPRDQTASGFSTSETIGSYNLQAWLKHTFHNLILKSEVVYGQNLTSFVMIGGYGARGIDGETDLTDDYSYTNIRTVSAWTDLETRGAAFRGGLFLGYTANMGADHDYIPLPGYSRNDDLHFVFRASPRVIYIHHDLRFEFEWSVVGAAYGLEWDSRHRVTKTASPTVNNHVIFSTKYFF